MSKDEIKTLINEVIRLGVGAVLMLGGLAIMVAGFIKGWTWPDFLIGAVTAMVLGLFATGLDNFKDLRKLRIELEDKKCELESKKATTYQVKNYERWQKERREEPKWKNGEKKSNNQLKKAENI